MFNFGLLSTHLPYVVFIAAYVFCFITCGGNKALDVDDVQPTEKIIVQKNIPVVVDNNDSGVSFYDAFYVGISASAKSKILDGFKIEGFVSIISVVNISGARYIFEMFSRPPPKLG